MINPIVANILNAVMCGLMSYGLLMTPQKFMKGGHYQSPWFDHLPTERNNRLYYLAQFMGTIMLCSVVIPTIVQPDAQILCYQMAVIHGVNIIHSCIFMCTSAYDNAKPSRCTSIGQWIFMTLLSMGFFVVTVLACLEDVPTVTVSEETYISKYVANIAMLAFSSTFGILFVLLPRHLLSMFWTTEGHQGGDDFCGFQVTPVTAHEIWWARCIGFAILGLNIGFGVCVNLEHPLYTLGSLITVSCLTLLNFHQVMMRPYRFITSYQIKVSWLPNIIMSAGMAAVLACAVIYS